VERVDFDHAKRCRICYYQIYSLGIVLESGKGAVRSIYKWVHAAGEDVCAVFRINYWEGCFYGHGCPGLELEVRDLDGAGLVRS